MSHLLRSCGPMRERRERGLILLTVLVVVTIGALAGTSALYIADAELEAADASLDRAQSRALAWSGVQAAMAELLEQRDALLEGAGPELTREWTLYTDPSGRSGMVRLIAWAGDRAAVSEGGKLDVNTASAEMLAALGVFDESVAQRIVAARKSRPLASVEELTGFEGITAEMLDGESATGGGDGAAAGLRALLTTFSFDPNVQAGLGDGGDAHRGVRRLNLNTPWSDRLKRGIADRLGSGVADGVEALMKRGDTFESMSAVVKTMRGLNIPPADWAVALDVFTASEDPYLPGRVDLSSAPAAVLACVPGIDEAAAEAIVSARSRLDAQTRSNPAWPLVQGLMTGEQFERAVDHLTTRSMQWRIRVEAGTLAAGAERGGGAFDGVDGGAARLDDRVVLEAVIDVASQRPRVAYLRDVTFLDAAVALAAMTPSGDEGSALDGSADLAAAGRSRESEGDEDEPLDSITELTFGTRLRESRASLGSGLDLRGTGGSGDLSMVGAEPEWGFGNEEGDPADMPEAAEEAPGEGVDRRLGRWTAGGGAG